MIKYYKLDKNNDIAKNMFKYREDYEKFNNVAINFLKGVGIESEDYIVSDNRLGIKPTENDFLKFAKALLTTGNKLNKDGYMMFNKKTSIHKRFFKEIEGYEIPNKPNISCCFKGTKFPSSCRFSGARIEMVLNNENKEIVFRVSCNRNCLSCKVNVSKDLVKATEDEFFLSHSEKQR